MHWLDWMMDDMSLLDGALRMQRAANNTTYCLVSAVTIVRYDDYRCESADNNDDRSRDGVRAITNPARQKRLLAPTSLLLRLQRTL